MKDRHWWLWGRGDVSGWFSQTLCLKRLCLAPVSEFSCFPLLVFKSLYGAAQLGRSVSCGARVLCPAWNLKKQKQGSLLVLCWFSEPLRVSSAVWKRRCVRTPLWLPCVRGPEDCVLPTVPANALTPLQRSPLPRACLLLVSCPVLASLQKFRTDEE